MEIIPLHPRDEVLNRLIAAGLLAAAALLLLPLARRINAPYRQLLSSHPWIFWMQLAALTWLLFPLPWPAYLLAFTSIVMFASQLLDVRRRVGVTSRG